MRLFITTFRTVCLASCIATLAWNQQGICDDGLMPGSNLLTIPSTDSAADAILRPNTSSRPVDARPDNISDNVVSGDVLRVPSLSSVDTGFWYVSSRHSPQTFDVAPCFRPAVSRYDQGIGYQPLHFDDLKNRLVPGVPICIVVHGSFVDVPSTCRESICTWQWLHSVSGGQPMQMIYFTWPSERDYLPTLQLDVNLLGRRGARNGFYLAELIQHLPSESPVCLLGHSHGTRVIASALHLMAGGRIQSTCHPWARVNGRRIRTVFAASAMDHDWLNPGHKYDRALLATECLLNLRNSRDPALKVYPLRMPLIAHRALGSTGLTRFDRSRLGYRGRKVLDYDVSDAVGNNHLWPYYFRQTGLAMVMRNYVYFPDHIPALTARND